MLLPGLCLAQDQNPINLFQPQVGQTQTFVNFSRDSNSSDTTVYAVTHISGDTAYVSWNGDPGPSIYWDNGILNALMLMGTGSLDTNGIYETLMDFPADYSGTMEQIKTGYVLGHTIQDITFDTLLVTCSYMSYIDIGNICDFITTSGYLVQSVNNDCFCIDGGYTNNLEPETLEFIAGPTALRAHKAPFSSIDHDSDEYFNVRGQLIPTGKPKRLFRIKVQRTE
jgi:hypothetical protein